MTAANRNPSYLERIWIRWCAPRNWLFLAALIVVVFAVEHLLGWRDYTSILSGTLPGEQADWRAFAGVLYVFTWLATVIVAPILVIGSVLNYAMMREG